MLQWQFSYSLSPLPFSLRQLGQEGKVPLQSAYLYFNVTEKVRRVVESYFRLDVPLYFSYSHLVCRTAIEGKLECRPSHRAIQALNQGAKGQEHKHHLLEGCKSTVGVSCWKGVNLPAQAHIPPRDVSFLGPLTPRILNTNLSLA